MLQTDRNDGWQQWETMFCRSLFRSSRHYDGNKLRHAAKLLRLACSSDAMRTGVRAFHLPAGNTAIPIVADQVRCRVLPAPTLIDTLMLPGLLMLQV